MKVLETEHFRYKGSELYCESVAVNKIAKQYGTPLYLYSKNHIIDKYKEFTEAFAGIEHKVFYASKSNFNLSIIALFNKLGAGIDVNSGGELYRALKAGVNPKDIILTGVGKTAEEIKMGLEYGVSLIKAESLQEIELINKIAESMSVVAPLAIRVNPDVNPKTHPYISTGLSENKFGINSKDAFKAYMKASQMPNISLRGIDMHIGSQIVEISPFVEAVEKLAELYLELKKKGIYLKHFDIGGGFGVRYLDEEPFSPSALAEAIIPIVKELNCRLDFEPGRFFMANAGILVSEILYTKQNGDKNFIVIDAAMSDLLRPSLYKAYHHIQPVVIKERDDYIADIVGPVCETGDYLGKKREISRVRPGELLAVMSSGAYGMVMSSNYNARRRAAEILVDDYELYVIRKRETFDDLVKGEMIANF